METIHSCKRDYDLCGNYGDRDIKMDHSNFRAFLKSYF